MQTTTMKTLAETGGLPFEIDGVFYNWNTGTRKDDLNPGDLYLSFPCRVIMRHAAWIGDSEVVAIVTD